MRESLPGVRVVALSRETVSVSGSADGEVSSCSDSEDNHESDTDKSEEGAAPNDAGEEGEENEEEIEHMSGRLPRKRKPPVWLTDYVIEI